MSYYGMIAYTVIASADQTGFHVKIAGNDGHRQTMLGFRTGESDFQISRRYRISLTPFLPATVFRTPLRVRALVRVRCPRTGKPRRCRNPR